MVYLSAEAYNNRGLLCKKWGKLYMALADYNQAITLNPNYAKAYNNRGVLYDELGENDLALADYNQVIKLNPKLAQTYSSRGFLYHKKLGKLYMALGDYNQAIKLNPGYAQAYLNRGFLYYQLKNLDKFKQDWKKAASLFKNQGKIKNYKQIVLLTQKIIINKK